MKKNSYQIREMSGSWHNCTQFLKNVTKTLCLAFGSVFLWMLPYLFSNHDSGWKLHKAIDSFILLACDPRRTRGLLNLCYKSPVKDCWLSLRNVPIPGSIIVAKEMGVPWLARPGSYVPSARIGSSIRTTWSEERQLIKERTRCC